VPVLVGVSFFFLAVFSKSFLNTRKLTPRSDFLLTLLACLSIGEIVIGFAHYGILANKLASTMVTYAPFLVVPAVLTCIRLGSIPARYYALAFLFFFIGSSAVAAKDLGLLPYNFITIYGMSLGSAIEALLFSLALAYRIRILKEAGIRSELQATSAQKQLADNIVKLRQQETFSAFASQVAHDIRSPLAALDMVLEELSALPEDLRLIVRGAVGRIKDISNNLLESNRKTSSKNVVSSDSNENLDEKTSNVLLSSLIDPLVSEKRMQYRSKIGIEIQANLNCSYGLFAEIESTEFKRVLSNLINNAAEAMEGKGKITLSVSESDGRIQISCSDSGKGIPPEIIGKLTQRGESHGKVGGSGLGLYHAKSSVEKWGGTLALQSEIGKGTSVNISLPKAQAPHWFVPKLIIPENSTVVILDDDSSIHQIWTGRFEKLLKQSSEITIKHFSTSKELIDWSQTQSTQEQITFLVDYELLGDPKTGLDVIEQLGIGKYSILVTSRFEEDSIRLRCKTLGVRLIPKGLAAFVAIFVQERARQEGLTPGADTSLPVVQAVFIDDSALNCQLWQRSAKRAGVWKRREREGPKRAVKWGPVAELDGPVI
jgi:signal transduction histidine kinase